MIYLDNAATSWPKPESVEQAMVGFMREVGANPGRSGHRLSIEAARIIYTARERVARLFNVHDPLRVIFTGNATEAINLALAGLLHPGDHVITSGMEHNSMMRPLRALGEHGIEITVVPCPVQGLLDPDEVKASFRKNTVMVAVNQGSNVNGCVQPVREIGRMARERDAFMLIDAAQTAGSLDIDMERDNIDLLAFTGHKGLFGPQGTGGLVLGGRIDTKRLTPLKRGGTGSRSEFEVQPEFLPDRYESGTPNTVGIAGLSEGVDFVLERGTGEIHRHEMQLTSRFLESVTCLKGVKIHTAEGQREGLATVSLTIEGIEAGEAGMILDERYGILTRVGLHCSPAAHRTIGTFPDGTIRFSLGYFNTANDIEVTSSALEEIISGKA